MPLICVLSVTNKKGHSVEVHNWCWPLDCLTIYDYRREIKGTSMLQVEHGCSNIIAPMLLHCVTLWPCPLTFWSLNRITGYHVMGFYPANFGLPRSFHSQVRSRHVTGRQTDTAHHFIMTLPMEVKGITWCWRITNKMSTNRLIAIWYQQSLQYCNIFLLLINHTLLHVPIHIAETFSNCIIYYHRSNK